MLKCHSCSWGHCYQSTGHAIKLVHWHAVPQFPESLVEALCLLGRGALCRQRHGIVFEAVQMSNRSPFRGYPTCSCVTLVQE